MSDTTMIRLLGNLVDVQKQVLEELKGLRLDMAVESCKAVESGSTDYYVDILADRKTYRLRQSHGCTFDVDKGEYV